MRLLLLLPLLMLAAPVSARDQGVLVPAIRSGDTVTWRTDGFDSIGLGTGATMEVRVGPAWSVRATGPAAAFTDLELRRDGHRIDLRRREGAGRGDPALEKQVRILVTLPRLAMAVVGGPGTMRIDRVTGGDFHAALGGSGSIAVGAVASHGFTVSIGGSGNVRAAGRTETLKINLGGSGGLDAPGLRAGRAEIASAGSGAIRARVDGRAAITLVGSGSVDLGPGARCTVTRMGSGRVTCGG